MTDRAKHTGECWLTKKAHCFSPGSPVYEFFDGECLRYQVQVPEQAIPALRSLADPEKPVRIRLTLTAELIDD